MNRFLISKEWVDEISKRYKRISENFKKNCYSITVLPVLIALVALILTPFSQFNDNERYLRWLVVIAVLFTVTYVILCTMRLAIYNLSFDLEDDPPSSIQVLFLVLATISWAVCFAWITISLPDVFLVGSITALFGTIFSLIFRKSYSPFHHHV